MKVKIGLIFMALLLVINVSVGAKGDAKSDVAATVNGAKISKSELSQFANTQQLYRQLAQINPDFAQLLFSSQEGKDLLSEYQNQKLNSLVDMKLLEIEAKNQGITIPEAEKNGMLNQQVEAIKKQNKFTDEELLKALKSRGINSLEQFKKIIWADSKDQVLIKKLQQQVVDSVAVTEKEIKDYYEENRSKFKQPAEVKAKHILIKTDDKSEKEAKAKAQKILKELKQGADFAKLAKKYSEGPSAKNGGELGYFGKGRMVAEFEEAAFNLEIGEVSEPVKTQFGYHIIKVEDKKESQLLSLSEAKEDIKNGLTQQKQQNKWNSFVKDLKENAEIEIKL
ncbi:peptidyl-prolyl cis-trans isomerase C/foldase protein PrsA [Orenia marismortui]|uniref:Peptidyl-prolyl cis-trans isomerase C/foldase protein PrsA n=1 Tax=Orenia marismortui TaxID=46469 RepID=A0A4V3GYF6_9FIRM|nr:peptidyl-prolyl cis-trans isomerase C/foldase protein PrsA [Orenia marismortui]